MPLRMRLREETAAAHASIERYLAFDARSWTLERYHAYLRCMHAFHRDIEPALEANAYVRAHDLACASRRKSDWLARDLAWFGLPHLAGAPAVAMRDGAGARAVGWAYVLEGATLGGRVLYKAVATRWSLDAQRGAAYLHGYGDDTSRHWANFARSLDALALDGAEADRAVAGANEAFAAMEAWFRINDWQAAGTRSVLRACDG